MLGPDGCGDITTRANFQIRGMTLAEADKIFHGLQEVGLSSVQSGTVCMPCRLLLLSSCSLLELALLA